MNFSSDAMADFEGLLEVNRKICKQQMAEKASPTLPTNCAVLPKAFYFASSTQAFSAMAIVRSSDFIYSASFSACVGCTDR